ncbi:MAG: DUF1292 domain-containing protein [Erysipelotrichaceae bacterium]|nr:DUF1292 domain-containing protein [Erysipelotrichaceae bacterium]
MEDKIFITDENGQEVQMNILFTFDMNDNNYVVVYPDGNDEEIYALRYDENSNLYIIEDEEELAMVQEVVDAFDGIEDEEDN